MTGGGTMMVKHSNLKLNTFKNYIFISNLVIPLKSKLTNNLIADTGCSGHYDSSNSNAKAAKYPIIVKLPNGGQMTSTHTHNCLIYHPFPQRHVYNICSQKCAQQDSYPSEDCAITDAQLRSLYADWSSETNTTK